MATVQVLMFIIMLGQSLYILHMREEGRLLDSAFRCPDNLLWVGIVLSSFVVVGAVFVTGVIIYLSINN